MLKHSLIYIFQNCLFFSRSGDNFLSYISHQKYEFKKNIYWPLIAPRVLLLPLSRNSTRLVYLTLKLNYSKSYHQILTNLAVLENINQTTFVEYRSVGSNRAFLRLNNTSAIPIHLVVFSKVKKNLRCLLIE